MSSIDNTPSVPKIEALEKTSFSESHPEPEEQSLMQEPISVQRRKGGRKPKPTSEERKKRNREAQAASRKRQTQYIEQLETIIKQHEEALQNLQQSHDSKADECLMLRYKNCLLERILLEKQIDVRAELRSKTEGSHSEGLPQSSPAQRALMKRQRVKVRRSASGSESVLQTRSSQASLTNSPRLRPAVPVQTLFLALNKAPIGLGKDGVILPYVDMKAQQQQQLPSVHDPHAYSQQALSELNIPATRPSMQTMTPSTADGSRNSKLDSTTTVRSNLCPSQIQLHTKRLQHADILYDKNPSDYEVGPGPYPQTFNKQQPPPISQHLLMDVQGQSPMQKMRPMQFMQQMQATHPNNSVYVDMNTRFNTHQPMLDADPFGLDTSMHFPTQFTFRESSMQR